MGTPDLKFINRKIPIIEVARALDLRVGENGNIHCWRPQLHQNGDRTASVGIRKKNNTVKCFGCGLGPFGPVDLVTQVLELSVGKAARWIASRFAVPELPRGKHLVQPRWEIGRYGFEGDLGILVRSGLWATLSLSTRAIAPVLIEFCDREPLKQTFQVTISYRAISRYSGIASQRVIAGALRELQELHWLVALPGQRTQGSGPVRDVSSYLITAGSDELRELANANFAKHKTDIEAERTLRAEAKAERRKLSITK